jgi:hypothetical protein
MENLDLRTLQKEAARALASDPKGNLELAKYNKLAHHNSQLFYRAVISDYIERWGGLPSETGPGKEVELILDE